MQFFYIPQTFNLSEVYKKKEPYDQLVELCNMLAIADESEILPLKEIIHIIIKATLKKKINGDVITMAARTCALMLDKFHFNAWHQKNEPVLALFAKCLQRIFHYLNTMSSLLFTRSSEQECLEEIITCLSLSLGGAGAVKNSLPSIADQLKFIQHTLQQHEWAASRVLSYCICLMRNEAINRYDSKCSMLEILLRQCENLNVLPINYKWDELICMITEAIITLQTWCAHVMLSSSLESSNDWLVESSLNCSLSSEGNVNAQANSRTWQKLNSHKRCRSNDNGKRSSALVQRCQRENINIHNFGATKSNTDECRTEHSDCNTLLCNIQLELMRITCKVCMSNAAESRKRLSLACTNAVIKTININILHSLIESDSYDRLLVEKQNSMAATLTFTTAIPSELTSDVIQSTGENKKSRICNDDNNTNDDDDDDNNNNKKDGLNFSHNERCNSSSTNASVFETNITGNNAGNKIIDNDNDTTNNTNSSNEITSVNTKMAFKKYEHTGGVNGVHQDNLELIVKLVSVLSSILMESTQVLNEFTDPFTCASAQFIDNLQYGSAAFRSTETHTQTHTDRSNLQADSSNLPATSVAHDDIENEEILKEYANTQWIVPELRWLAIILLAYLLNVEPHLQEEYLWTWRDGDVYYEYPANDRRKLTTAYFNGAKEVILGNGKYVVNLVNMTAKDCRVGVINHIHFQPIPLCNKLKNECVRFKPNNIISMLSQLVSTHKLRETLNTLIFSCTPTAVLAKILLLQVTCAMLPENEEEEERVAAAFRSVIVDVPSIVIEEFVKLLVETNTTWAAILINHDILDALSINTESISHVIANKRNKLTKSIKHTHSNKVHLQHYVDKNTGNVHTTTVPLNNDNAEKDAVYGEHKFACEMLNEKTVNNDVCGKTYSKIDKLSHDAKESVMTADHTLMHHVFDNKSHKVFKKDLHALCHPSTTFPISNNNIGIGTSNNIHNRTNNNKTTSHSTFVRTSPVLQWIREVGKSALIQKENNNAVQSDNLFLEQPRSKESNKSELKCTTPVINNGNTTTTTTTINKVISSVKGSETTCNRYGENEQQEVSSLTLPACNVERWTYELNEAVQTASKLVKIFDDMCEEHHANSTEIENVKSWLGREPCHAWRIASILTSYLTKEMQEITLHAREYSLVDLVGSIFTSCNIFIENNSANDNTEKTECITHYLSHITGTSRNEHVNKELDDNNNTNNRSLEENEHQPKHDCNRSNDIYSPTIRLLCPGSITLLHLKVSSLTPFTDISTNTHNSSHEETEESINEVKKNKNSLHYLKLYHCLNWRCNECGCHTGYAALSCRHCNYDICFQCAQIKTGKLHVSTTANVGDVLRSWRRWNNHSATKHMSENMKYVFDNNSNNNSNINSVNEVTFDTMNGNTNYTESTLKQNNLHEINDMALSVGNVLLSSATPVAYVKNVQLGISTTNISSAMLKNVTESDQHSQLYTELLDLRYVTERIVSPTMTSMTIDEIDPLHRKEEVDRAQVNSMNIDNYVNNNNALMNDNWSCLFVSVIENLVEHIATDRGLTHAIMETIESCGKLIFLYGPHKLPRKLYTLISLLAPYLSFEFKRNLCKFLSIDCYRYGMKHLQDANVTIRGIVHGDIQSNGLSCKVKVYREDMTTTIDTLYSTFSSLPSLRTKMEFEFEGEEGTGSGPTQELYSTLSRHFRSVDMLWAYRDDSVNIDNVYVNTVVEEDHNNSSTEINSTSAVTNVNTQHTQTRWSNNTNNHRVNSNNNDSKSNSNENDYRVNETLNLELQTEKEEDHDVHITIAFPTCRKLYYKAFYVLGAACARSFVDGYRMNVNLISEAWDVLRSSSSLREMFWEEEDLTHTQVWKLFEAIFPTVAHSYKEILHACANSINDIDYVAEFDLYDDNGALITRHTVKTFVVHRVQRYLGNGLCNLYAFARGLLTCIDLSSFYMLSSSECSRVLCGSFCNASYNTNRKELYSISISNNNDNDDDDNADSCKLFTSQQLRESITEAHGYHSNSPQVEMFATIVGDEFTREQQEYFLEFLTGSSQLPLNGLSGLGRKITVVRKEMDSANEETLPSCNTCFLYFKLPPYTSHETMKKRLILAITEGRRNFSLSESP